MKEEAVITLDPEAAHAAKHLAETWGVSVEEAVRRALTSADAGAGGTTKQAKIDAFLELSRRLNLDDAKVQAWINLVHDARR